MVDDQKKAEDPAALWPDEVTPPPLALSQNMTPIEAELELAQHENVRLKLELAAANAKNFEMQSELKKAFRTIRALDARITTLRKGE
jgi:hypothetical protein